MNYKYEIIKSCRNTAYNERFHKIAALPSFENICYFCPLVARWEVYRMPQPREAATTLAAILGQRSGIIKIKNQ